jgi:hypothetical protein
MDFSKLIDNKKQVPADPEIQFEDLLRKAANDPGLRPQFFRNFLNYNLYVIGKPKGDYVQDKDGNATAIKSTSLQLNFFKINGVDQIPVFSSLARLQKAIKGEVPYIRVNGKVVFEGLPKGARVVLNPFSDCGKEFMWEEIQRILDGSIFQTTNKGVFTAASNIFLGQPADYPHKMINCFISYFESSLTVEKAYLAQVYVKDSGDAPHCIVGLKMLKDSATSFDEVLGELGIIVKDTMPKGQMLDLSNIDSGGTVNEYLVNQTKPFYVR